MDKVEEIGITIEDEDTIETISGIGGSEFVYKKHVDSISMGDLILCDFKVEIGVMDFLKSVGAIIDLDKMIVNKL